MTRASLLRILDHVNGISDAEIRELEQLATAFPYCQTAHLLLAKAAHDRGNMLAGQRLRRAATYAADRELLRHLLKQPTPPAVAPESGAEMLPANVAPAPTAPPPRALELPPGAGPDQFAVAPTPAEAVVTPKLAGAPPEPLAAVVMLPPAHAATTLEEQDFAVAPAAEPTTGQLPAPPVIGEQPKNESPVLAEDPEKEPTSAAAFRPAPPQPLLGESVDCPAATEPATVEQPPSSSAPTTDSPLPPDARLPDPVAETLTPETAAANHPPATDTTTASPPEAAEKLAETVPAADAQGPAVAPPIRPPAEAGISRFEFGLGESRLPEPSGYRLPSAEQDDDELTPESEYDALLPSDNAAPPSVTAPFRADAALGYALGAGSRLGYNLQAHDGSTLNLPLEVFFEPDALLLAHARAHQPKPRASSLDLINRFLETQPRIKTPGGVPLPATDQADLSVRSTRAAPALASESLAKIMVQQGKQEKAIEIYERLMVRQPEKKAYFAEQIQQLQQLPE